MARTRSAFRKLSDIRVREAKALLDAKLWDGAYYLAGYAVECGLKACILALIQREGVIFDDGNRGFVEKCWTHNLEVLRAQAGLDAAWRAEAPPGSALALNWITAKDWTESRRYDRRSRSEAEALYQALTDPNDGVLPWVKKHW